MTHRANSYPRPFSYGRGRAARLLRFLFRNNRDARVRVLRTPASTDHRLRTRFSPGFTLLEIAAVLFIMGLMLLIAMPYLGGFRGAQLKSASRRLAGRAT